ncbi:MAG: biotin transporter BioY [Oscillospiraceae bacterium]|nr:biotin transporter BioY [Oscillospiraceae bacterium]
MENKRLFTVRGMVFTAIMAAAICITAPLSIPMPTAVPLSLATLAVYLAGALLGKVKGSAAVAVYILLGLVGLPVFSGFMGGPAVLFGATGGYIIGYLPCAFITGAFSESFGGKPLALVVGMTLGTLLLYIIGTVWFMVFTGSDIMSALMVCVVPFLVGDVLKVTAAAAVSVSLRKKILLFYENNEK